MNELEQLINELKILVERIKIVDDDFPMDDYYLFDQAIQSKRNSDYEASLKLYLKIFRKYNVIHVYILHGLFKTIAAAGYVSFSYQLLQKGDNVMKSNGYYDNPCAFHIQRIQYAIYTNTLDEYLQEISGNKNYVFNRPYQVMYDELLDYLQGRYKTNSNQQFSQPNKIYANANVNLNDTSINQEIYYIIGVRFINQFSGCYYYRCQKNEYVIGDKLTVPTKNGLQLATVVFVKTYYNAKELPIRLEMMLFAPDKV
jgi:hypothetical protein